MQLAISGMTGAFCLPAAAGVAAPESNSRIREFQTGANFPTYHEYENRVKHQSQTKFPHYWEFDNSRFGVPPGETARLKPLERFRIPDLRVSDDNHYSAADV